MSALLSVFIYQFLCHRLSQGSDGFGSQVNKCLENAEYLYNQLKRRTDFELVFNNKVKLVFTEKLYLFLIILCIMFKLFFYLERIILQQCLSCVRGLQGVSRMHGNFKGDWDSEKIKSFNKDELWHIGVVAEVVLVVKDILIELKKIYIYNHYHHWNFKKHLKSSHFSNKFCLVIYISKITETDALKLLALTIYK